MVDLIQLYNGLKLLVTGGVILRILYCLVKIQMNPDDQAMYMRRMKNIALYYIYSISTLSLLSLIEKYIK